jgi:ribosomal protein L28
MADELICKYCGKKFVKGFSCRHSPSKKHIALTDGKNCVYCGQKFIAGFTCSYSPSKKHLLDEI